METGAEFSSCRKYRYSLTRKWSDGPSVLFVMLNPSLADETQNDRTINRCISFAKTWGFGSLTVGNLFAFCTPSPDEMKEADDPIGSQNDQWLSDLSASADLTVAAWGDDGKFKSRGAEVMSRLHKPHFLKISVLGEPRHPLYLAGDLKPLLWVLP